MTTVLSDSKKNKRIFLACFIVNGFGTNDRVVLGHEDECRGLYLWQPMHTGCNVIVVFDSLKAEHNTRNCGIVISHTPHILQCFFQINTVVLMIVVL